MLDAEGVPCALDDGPISRGIKGAAVQLDTHDLASIAQSGSPVLQVRINSLTASQAARLHLLLSLTALWRPLISLV